MNIMTLMIKMEEDFIDKENKEQKIEQKLKEQKNVDKSIELALAIYELAKQVEDNNRLMKTLIRKIELLETKTAGSNEPINLLSEVDEKIINIIEQKGKATAEEIKALLNYKGRNAASARLNNLCRIGVLKKGFAGRKAYFFINKDWQGSSLPQDY